MSIHYLTPDDVASRLQVSRQVVYNWINDGRLRAVKAGRTLRIPQATLDAFLQPVHAGEMSTSGVEPDRGFHIDRFTTAAQAAFEAANGEVRTRQHLQLDVEHVLWALVQQADGIAQRVFQHLRIDPQQVMQQLDQALATLPNDPTFHHSPHALAVAARIPKVLERAEELASQLPELQIDTAHVLQAICAESDGVSARILHVVGVTPKQLRVAIIDVRTLHIAPAPHTTADSRPDWEQRIEQQLARIESELVAIRSMLTHRTSPDTV
jgi:excisionase family DNA binding protein